MLDFADAPLFERVSVDRGPLSVLIRMDDVLSLRAGGRFTLTEAIGVTASVPLVLSATLDGAKGVGLGDARIGAIAALARGPHARLSLVPEIRLPTGSSSMYLGDEGLGASVTAAADAAAGPVTGTVNLGLDLRTFTAEDNVRPGPGLLAGAAVGLRLSEGVSIQLETRGHKRLQGVPLDDPPAGYHPSAGGLEAMLSGRGHLPSGMFVAAGVGGGLASGFATPRSRISVQVGRVFGPTAGTGPTLADDPATPEPVEPEGSLVPVRVYVQDEAGIPLDADLVVRDGPAIRTVDGGAELLLSPGLQVVEARARGFGPQERDLLLVRDLPEPDVVRFILLPEQGDAAVELDLQTPEESAVVGARVSVDGRPVGTTASGGGLRVGGLPSGTRTIETRADALRDRALQVEASPESTGQELVLLRERGSVQVLVVDGAGRPVPGARSRFSGPDRLGPYDLGARGARVFVLRPGTWDVLVTHPEHGAQQRRILLPDADGPLEEVRIVLQPPEQGQADLEVRVVDADNRPVPGARVFVDDTPYGTTSSGGSVSMDKLGIGARTIRVEGDLIAPIAQTVRLHDGLQELLVVGHWQSGSTLLRARSAEGMAPNARVRFSGPEPRERTALGPDGIAHERLAPGPWTFLFTSPTLGASQQDARVPETPGTLTIVDALLGQATGTTLAVAVADPDGDPIPDAVVALGGLRAGTTTTAGTLVLPDAGAGENVLSVTAPPYAEHRQAVVLRGERVEQRVPLSWGVGAVRIRAVHDGEPVTDAVVRLGGPAVVRATPLDADGARLFSLTPGEWQVVLASPSMGLEQVPLTVTDKAGLTELTVEMAPPRDRVAATIVRVQAPDGSPIPEATARLDQGAYVDASSGYATFEDVTPGDHRLEILAPDHVPAVREVQLEEGVQERIVPLDWAPRSLVVHVRGADGPVPGARITLEGPEDAPTARTDASGVSRLDLAPGTWEVMASAEGLATRRTRVHVTKTGTTELEMLLPAARVQVVGDRVLVLEDIYFPTGEATLDAPGRDLLAEVADTLRAHPELVRVEVAGHTDSSGSTALNMRLSRARAAAVVQVLVELGVPPERLVARGYGPTRPEDTNATETGRARNRRVEMVSER